MYQQNFMIHDIPDVKDEVLDNSTCFGEKDLLHLQSGDDIMHLTDGACHVKEIVNMRTGTKKQKYYKLIPYADEQITLFIPITLKGIQKLRPLMDVQMLHQITEKIDCQEVKWIKKIEDRRKLYNEAMRAADYGSIVKLTKMMMQRDKEHGLSYSDKTILVQMQKITISELAVAEKKSYDTMLALIEQQVDA